jgi:hypothetical protein
MFTVHSLRHSHVTHYVIDRKLPLAIVQKQVGHRSLKTTSIYLSPSAESMGQAYSQARHKENQKVHDKNINLVGFSTLSFPVFVLRFLRFQILDLGTDIKKVNKIMPFTNVKYFRKNWIFCMFAEYLMIWIQIGTFWLKRHLVDKIVVKSVLF